MTESTAHFQSIVLSNRIPHDWRSTNCRVRLQLVSSDLCHDVRYQQSNRPDDQ